jgi:hypothetical protein
MFAVGRHLVPTLGVVAVLAHPLGIVVVMGVRTGCNEFSVLSYFLLSNFWLSFRVLLAGGFP